MVLLIIGLLMVNLYQQEVMHWSTIDSNLGIFFLINLNVVLLLLTILLVLRNLIKLIYEVRHRKLGFRLKFKLTLAFILVTALPMVMFFFIANVFLKSSMNFWFQGQFNSTIVNAEKVIQHFERKEEDQLKHHAIQAAAEFLNQKSSHWPRILEHYQFDGVVFYDPNLKILKKQINAHLEPLWSPFSGLLPPSKLFNAPLVFYQLVDHSRLVRVIYHLPHQPQIMEALILQSKEFAQELTTVKQNLKDQKKLIQLEEPIRTNFTTYLLLFTLLIIFAGIWFSYYLARSIVEPLEILAEGTKRIARGDLDFQIKLEIGDEVGMLLESFNSMTSQLRQNQQKLAESRGKLVDSNNALEERNIFVELVLQNIQSGILFIDNSGYIKGVNPYMLELSKIKQKTVIGKHYRSILNKEALHYFEEINAKLTQSKQKLIREETHISISKKPLHVNLELYQLKTPQGEALGRLLVVSDLTEFDRLTRARAWREVARRIAHEIKNPLTPIQLSAQRIRRNYLSESEESGVLDHCTATIIQEVAHLKNMVNEFSNFARLPEVNPSPGQINQILTEIAHLYEASIPKGIELKLALDQNIPQALLDTEQIKQVFKNLLDNSIAAMQGKEGRILLRTRYLKSVKLIQIELLDQGAGIPKAMLGSIFDPYVTTKEEGTGLGLAIVQQIVQDHGGFIRLENLDGPQQTGARCTIELPANPIRT